MLNILTSVLGMAMNRQNSETGHITANNYINSAKTVSQLMKGE